MANSVASDNAFASEISCLERRKSENHYKLCISSTSAGYKRCKFPRLAASSNLWSKSCYPLFLTPRSVYLCTQNRYNASLHIQPHVHMPVIYPHALISHHASSSVSGGCGVPLGELSHSMCLNLLLTSLSLIC